MVVVDGLDEDEYSKRERKRWGDRRGEVRRINMTRTRKRSMRRS